MQLPTKIDSFSGTWGFLSNFAPCDVWLDGVKYTSVEIAYQAAKTLILKQREKFLLNGVTPAMAKKMGRGLKLRPDWEEVKVGIMRDLLMQKFNPTILRRKLIATFQAELIEGNFWGDTFWGVCRGVGENWLGKLLMEVRKHYGSGGTYESYRAACGS